MNRIEEFNQLKQQHPNTPSSLDHIVQQQVTHYYHYQKRKKYLYYPILSLCTFILIVTITFNCFPHLAYACKDIPVLEDVAKTLCFNQTVKDCIDNDYAIYVHQADKDLTLEYMIIDETQATFFIKKSPQQTQGIEDIHMINKGEDYHIVTSMDDKMIKIQCLYNDIDQIEFDQKLSFTFYQQNYQFSLNIDKSQIKMTKTMIINKDITINDQKLTIQKIEISPSIMKIYIEPDKNNTLIFDDAQISIYNAQHQYINTSGIHAIGDQDGKIFTLASPYFQKDFTLTFDSFSFISPEYDQCFIDIQNQTITPLPKEINIDQFEIKDSKLKITLSAPMQYTSYPLITSYFDNHQNKSLHENSWSSIEKNGKMLIQQTIEIPYQEGHTYTLDIDYKQVYNIYETINILTKDFQ